MSDLPVSVAAPVESHRGLILGIAVHGSTVVAVGGQGRDLLLVSEDSGMKFHEGQSPGRGLRGAFVRADGLWVCGEWGHLAHSPDLGSTWATLPSKTKGCLFGVVADDAGALWVAGDGGYVATSKNGKTFGKVKGVSESIARIRNSPLGVLIPGDAPGHLYIAKGKTITKTAAQADTDLMSAVVTPAGTLITVGSQGTVLRSTDHGESFEKVAVPSGGLLCAVECFEDGRVVIVAEKGTILLSKDDGKTFELVTQHLTAGTLWCCRRAGDVLLAGGERGIVLALGERSATTAATPSARRAAEAPAFPPPPPGREHWAAPAPSPAAQCWTPPEPPATELRNGIYVSPALRALLYPRRGGIPTAVRPLPTAEEAWATFRRIAWASDRAGMQAKPRRSGIWDEVTSSSKIHRLVGERLLDPAPRVVTAEEDATLLRRCLEQYGGFLAHFREDLHEAIADNLVVSVGLPEAIRRLYAGLDDELPYVGVGPFGRIRDLLAIATDEEWKAARAAILEALETEIEKDADADRRIADLLWTTTFLLPLGRDTSAGDEERALHDRALANTVKFGDFKVHACGLAAGDLASLERFRQANKGQTRHEFFAPFNGRMYLASVLEIAGSEAGPTLARMKPSDPWEKDQEKNTYWAQLIAHIAHDDVLEALYKEQETPEYVWGLTGLVTAASFDKDRVLSFLRNKKHDGKVADKVEAGMASPPPPVRPPSVPGSDLAAALQFPSPYEPPPARRPVPIALKAAPEPVVEFRDDERAAITTGREIYDDAVKYNDVSIRRASPEDLEAWVAHAERWALPTTVADLLLAPKAVHPRLLALGFTSDYHSFPHNLARVLLEHGTSHLPLLRAVAEEPNRFEAFLEASQAIGDAAFVPAIARAFAGKKHKAPARSWIVRHPAHAIAGALAVFFATGADKEAPAEAARVLRYLDGRGQRAPILEAARARGDDEGAVVRLLDEDPLAAPKAKKPTIPAFAAASALPPLREASGGGSADPAAVERLLVELAFSNADEVHPGVTRAKAAYTATSRAEFAWALFEAWLAAGADPKAGWAMQAVGFFGDDESARKLTALAKAWPGENASARAQAALDALQNIGTDAALMNIHLLAEKSKFPAFKAAAKERIDTIAMARGLTADELADRLVPTLGLEEDGAGVLDFGARQFTLLFGEDLLPRVRDAAGKITGDLPKPAKTDDAALAKAAKGRLAAIKKDAKTSASLQIARMERAMKTGRRIPAAIFLACFTQHPWMSHLARRFVWGASGPGAGAGVRATFRVAEDGSLASVTDEAFALGADEDVILLHPLAFPEGDLARWGQVFTDYEILQPFPQLTRAVYRVDDAERDATVLGRWNDQKVAYGALRGLESRGWERWYDASVQMARRLGQRAWVVLETEPGWHPSQTAEDIEPQKIEGLRLQGGGETSFGALSPLVFSEIVYDLTSLVEEQA